MLKLFNDTPTLGESTTGIIHTCDLCGRKGRWSNLWSWYGSMKNLDDGIILKLCGCREIGSEEAERLLNDKIESETAPGLF